MILSVCQRLTLCEQRRPVRMLLMETNVCYLKRKTSFGKQSLVAFIEQGFLHS